MSVLFDKRSGADLSPCRTWRYALWRYWDGTSDADCVLFVGLNPSTADEVRNDTTVTKCIGFARRWGYGGMYLLNLFGFRATKPAEMIQSPDPVGPGNDEAFNYYRTRVRLIVAAWGSPPVSPRHWPQWPRRIQAVLDRLATPVQCLGRTKDGSPRHPSRLAYETPLECWWSPHGV